jgi:hypothetical protein
MGFGISLSLITIGAVLAFGVTLDLWGLNLDIIGFILIAVGLVSMLLTFAYWRPRPVERPASGDAPPDPPPR